MTTETTTDLTDFLRREDMVLVKRERYRQLLGTEYAAQQARIVCEEYLSGDDYQEAQAVDVLRALDSRVIVQPEENRL